MKIAIVSDIHGNREAFCEVLADMERAGADAAVNLGDIVGYGPEPEEAARLIREKSIPSVMGNHELAIAKPNYLRWFNESARRSLLLTRDLLQPETRKWLSGLPPFLVHHGALMVHGCPPDSITEYLFEMDDEALERIFASSEQRLSFVGHTHTLELVSFGEGSIERTEIGRGLFPLEKSKAYIVNVGSVGQPRDGDNHAKYVLWDETAYTVEVRYVSYDIASTVDKILRLGFPEVNAKRLW
ncbi:MAG: metallophosphatase family protein [Desulfobacteraceae bacterium]|nr:metallophosphatase family protein [Desulfobacteraceae bacterium]